MIKSCLYSWKTLNHYADSFNINPSGPCRSVMGQRTPVCELDASLHGHAARAAKSRTQNLYQSQVRRPAQHPDSRRLPRSPGKTSAKTLSICNHSRMQVQRWPTVLIGQFRIVRMHFVVERVWLLHVLGMSDHDHLFLQKDAQERQIDTTDCHQSPVSIDLLLTPPSSTEKPTNPWIRYTVRLEARLHDSIKETAPSLIRIKGI